jgi:hypothetical protein
VREVEDGGKEKREAAAGYYFEGIEASTAVMAVLAATDSHITGRIPLVSTSRP